MVDEKGIDPVAADRIGEFVRQKGEFYSIRICVCPAYLNKASICEDLLN